MTKNKKTYIVNSYPYAVRNICITLGRTSDPWTSTLNVDCLKCGPSCVIGYAVLEFTLVKNPVLLDL